MVSARRQDGLSVVCCRPFACDSQFTLTLSLSSISCCNLSRREPSCSSGIVWFP